MNSSENATDSVPQDLEEENYYDEDQNEPGNNQSSNKSDPFLEYTSFNGKRYPVPYYLLRLNLEYYLVLILLICVGATLLNGFIIIQTLRFGRRRATPVNLLIVLSRSVFVILPWLVMCLLFFSSNGTMCLSTYIVFPVVILLDKMLMTCMATIRHLFIFMEKFMGKCSLWCLVLSPVILAILLSVAPLLTIFDELPPLYGKCTLDPDTLLQFERSTPKFVFLFMYFIILVNSVIVDVLCYVRILNYMRHHSVQVMVVPTTSSERNKTFNVITAPSSLLIWLIVCVTMVPSSLLLLKSPSFLEPEDIVVLVNYQIILLFTQGCVIPIIYIGSSADFRHDFIELQRRCCCKLCVQECGDIRSNVEAASGRATAQAAAAYVIGSVDDNPLELHSPRLPTARRNMYVLEEEDIDTSSGFGTIHSNKSDPHEDQLPPY